MDIEDYLDGSDNQSDFLSSTGDTTLAEASEWDDAIGRIRLPRIQKMSRPVIAGKTRRRPVRNKMKKMLEARAIRVAQRKSLKDFMDTPEFVKAWAERSKGARMTRGAKKSYAKSLYAKRESAPAPMTIKGITIPEGVSVPKIKQAAKEMDVEPSEVADAINKVADENGVDPSQVKKADVKTKVKSGKKILGMPKMVAYPVIAVVGIGILFGTLKLTKIL